MEDRRVNQADLRRLLERVGVDVGRQTISQWFNGDNVPAPNTVALIARVLQADPAEALREAGHNVVVDTLRRPPGTPDPVEPPDPYIQQILDDPLLPDDVKPRVIAYYRRRMQQIHDDVRAYGHDLSQGRSA
jgi:transcriptional regulator with XRE-family HTH domain